MNIKLASNVEIIIIERRSTVRIMMISHDDRAFRT
jgi:hypothetical protein